MRDEGIVLPKPSFSPLFIGESSSTRWTSSKRSWRCRFSPLFIGESSSTTSVIEDIKPGTSFQSPLHRGVLFNRGSSDMANKILAFQSPLHRGVLFNSTTAALAGGITHVSVPSSSGSPLQPCWPLQYSESCSVSVPSSSGSPLQQPVGQEHEPHRGVSVPSSSGSPLQPRSARTARCSPCSFSPLFIGESSSTEQPGHMQG